MAEIREIENKILELDTEITEAAYERFTQGDVSDTQLTEFYSTLNAWSNVSQVLLEKMQILDTLAR